MSVAPRFARITDEALTELRGRIGKLVPPVQPHIDQATPDTIRHWTMGIGDRNPLYLDPVHAASTKHGGLVAPPTILFAMSRVVSGYVGGLPGVHAMFAGADWHWHRDVRSGERITSEARLKALVERKGRFAGHAVQQIYEVHFYDEDRREVGWADSWCFRTERDTARELGKYSGAGVDNVTAAELATIQTAYRSEAIRGSETRRFADVKVGDSLGEIVRGPYTPTMAVAFVQGWGGLYVYAHGYAFDFFERHPATAIVNAQAVPEPPERVHWDNEMAQAAGVPRAYDYGPERVSWCGSLATNWMGDDGFLRRLNIQVRRHNMVGDTVWITGRVVGLEPTAEGGIVNCEVRARNQDGELSAVGGAEVVLTR